MHFSFSIIAEKIEIIDEAEKINANKPSHKDGTYLLCNKNQ
jgi:hypothetical protein